MSGLQRPLQPLPEDVRAALEGANLLDAYEERPAYQRNDYLAWIGRAHREETRSKRLRQMLDELREGGVYMGMDHEPSQRPQA